ncbi:uncharacterized protein LOC116290437 [Actinia tenebrosa]|uniref:Uncharacterized protein LOC116290437 n=1 Tax=Actinia tenebrosa TaxID=6105 RepID=A0A6P8HE78_ACTTE|nr:uncharacterized protein LOC116290437 [Actinia tenebrosa]
MDSQYNFETYAIAGSSAIDLRRYWNTNARRIQRLIERGIEELGAAKVSIVVEVNLMKDETETTVWLRTKMLTVLESTDLDQRVSSQVEPISESLAKYTREGSGWTVTAIKGATISIARYVPTRGGSYVPLPTFIEGKKAIISVRNKDNRCFQWALRSALYPVNQNPFRTSKYPHDDLDWSDVEFPMEIRCIPDFEERNELAINVYGVREKTIVPLHVPCNRGERIHLFYHGEHYSWVKSPSRLFAMHSKDGHKRFYCDACLLPFKDLKALKKHDQICRGASAKNSAAIVRCDGEADEPVLYRGPNAARNFLTALEEEEEYIRQRLVHKKKAKLTKEQLEAYHAAQKCHVCELGVLKYGRRAKKAWDKDGAYLGEAHPTCGRYAKDGEKPGKPSTHCFHCGEPLEEDFYTDKVMDCCEITGEYKGAAHWKCRHRIDPNMEIPVFFHNLRGYDSHLLLQGVEGHEVKCIPNNKERYMSVTIGKLKFLDSQQFMADSLANLAKYNEDSPISDEYGAERKGVYPYEYMNCWERFEETQLPPQESFYITLNEAGISDAEYSYAQEVWVKYDCKNIGDYHDVYLLSDVVLLADVFQSFRKMAMS